MRWPFYQNTRRLALRVLAKSAPVSPDWLPSGKPSNEHASPPKDLGPDTISMISMAVPTYAGPRFADFKSHEKDNNCEWRMRKSLNSHAIDQSSSWHMPTTKRHSPLGLSFFLLLLLISLLLRCSNLCSTIETHSGPTLTQHSGGRPHGLSFLNLMSSFWVNTGCYEVARYLCSH